MGRVAPLAVPQLHAAGQPGDGHRQEHVLQVNRGGLPGHQVPVAGQVVALEEHGPLAGQTGDLIIAVQVGFEEEPLLVQAVAHPEVGLFARGQILGQESPVLGPLQVEGAGEGGHRPPGKKGQGPVDFFGDFSPVFELEDGFGRRPRLHPGDHGGEDAGATAQKVLTYQGVGEGAFARFHRAHHRQPEAVLGQVGPGPGLSP